MTFDLSSKVFSDARRRIAGYDLAIVEYPGSDLRGEHSVAIVRGKIANKMYDQREVVAQSVMYREDILALRAYSFEDLACAAGREYCRRLEQACERVVSGLPHSNHLRWRGKLCPSRAKPKQRT